MVKSLHNDGSALIAEQSQALERLWALASLLGHGLQHGLAERGLSLARANLLWQLHSRGPSSQSQLSKALRVTPRNITGLVDGLELDGFVARSAHPSDRRATLVALTEKGATLAATMREQQNAFAQQLFADVSSTDLQTFVAMLDRVLARIHAVVPALDH